MEEGGFLREEGCYFQSPLDADQLRRELGERAWKGLC